MILPSIETAVALIMNAGRSIRDEDDSLVERVNNRIELVYEIGGFEFPVTPREWDAFNQWRFGVRAGLKHTLYRQEQALASIPDEAWVLP